MAKVELSPNERTLIADCLDLLLDELDNCLRSYRTDPDVPVWQETIDRLKALKEKLKCS